MASFEFALTLCGDGDTVEEAWQDAVECFQMDPGSAPDDAKKQEG